MQDPVDKLCLLILLSALKKRAQTIQMRADDHEFVVHFTIDGVQQTEMRPAVELWAPVFEKLAEMAGVRVPASGDAVGVIQLAIGEHAAATFALTVRAHGDVQLAELRVVARENYP